MTNTTLQNLLTRLYLKASHAQPLALSEAEAALYGGSDKKMRSLLAGLKNGDSLADLLQKAGGLPDMFVRVIRTGEQSGRLAEALKATLDGLPLDARLGFQAWALQFYLLLNLGGVLLFLLFHAENFSRMYGTLFGADQHFAGSYHLLLLLGHPGVLLCGLAVLTLPLLFYRQFRELLFRLLPPLNRNRRRLASLELATRYLLLRTSGYAPDRCLEGLTEADSGNPVVGLSAAVAAIRNGTPVADALEPVINSSRLEAFCSIAVAEATPDPAASLAEQSALVAEYMKEHLARELAALFRWATVICGVVVALAVLYAFNSILYSYTLLEYLP